MFVGLVLSESYMYGLLLLDTTGLVPPVMMILARKRGVEKNTPRHGDDHNSGCIILEETEPHPRAGAKLR